MDAADEMIQWDSSRSQLEFLLLMVSSYFIRAQYVLTGVMFDLDESFS
jgi:hypothetical protein